MTRILITGSGGQVGAELVTALKSLGEVHAFNRSELDLRDTNALIAAVSATNPDVIVNAAAYTAVDRAEIEPEQATAVNGVAPGALAAEAKRLGVWLVHHSTDYVFDGSKTGAYIESDVPNPLNVYGRTKLKGELAVQAAGGKHLILRTSWVYGMTGKNFLVTIRRLACERAELKIVNDQIGAPTWSRDIANATCNIVAQLMQCEETAQTARSGIYNVSAGGFTSWYDFATAILAATVSEGKAPCAKLLPIPTSCYPTPAIRPLNSVLSQEKLRHAFGTALPPWRTSLSACLGPGS